MICSQIYIDKLKSFGIDSNFTLDELFEILPAHIDTSRNEPFNNYWFHLQKRRSQNIQYIVNYRCDTYEIDLFNQRILFNHNIYDENLADCIAILLITLIENKYLELK